MKRLVYFLLVPFTLSSQLKIEWHKEFEGKNLRVAGFHFTGGNVITCLNHITFRFSPNGSELQSFGEHSGGLVMQAYNKKLLFIGGPQFAIRTEEGDLEKKIMLLGEDNSNISVKHGKALSDALYVVENYNYLTKFNLEGERIFTVRIAELSYNQFVDAGGKYIYLQSLINQPNLGPRLMQYDTLGNQNWSIPTGDAYAMVADKEGNCFIVTANGETTVVKYNTDGEVVWSKLLKGQWAQGASLFGDSLLLCGNISLNAITDKNQSCAYSIMSASSGEILQQQVVDLYEDKNEHEKMTTIATDGKAIYIGGIHSDEDPRSFLVKLSKEGNTTGLKDEKSSRSTFNIFPNPGGSKFTISCTEAGAGTLKVTVRNNLGQVIQKKDIECAGQQSWELDLGKQAAGNYTVEIVSGKDNIVKKIVVQ